MHTLRIIGQHSTVNIMLLSALLASSVAQAHIVLLDPPGRSQDNSLIIAPCGGIQASISVATYTAGSDIEITFDLAQKHVDTTDFYISYDDFVTRTKLATFDTLDGEVTYTMTVPLPAGPIGPAVFQLNHANYYSCADITLEKAPGFEINTGLTDAWYNPATNGQGFFITVFPDLGVMSVAWFTYDTELPGEDAQAQLGDPGHRWLTAVGGFAGDQALLDVTITSGGLFDTPTDLEQKSDGTLSVQFTGCNSGSIAYDIPSIGLKGTVPIQRVANDNIALCEALGNSR